MTHLRGGGTGSHEGRAGDVVGNLEHVAYDRERRNESLLAHDGEAPEDHTDRYDEQCAQQGIVHVAGTFPTVTVLLRARVRLSDCTYPPPFTADPPDYAELLG